MREKTLYYVVGKNFIRKGLNQFMEGIRNPKMYGIHGKARSKVGEFNKRTCTKKQK